MLGSLWRAGGAGAQPLPPLSPCAPRWTPRCESAQMSGAPRARPARTQGRDGWSWEPVSSQVRNLGARGHLPLRVIPPQPGWHRLRCPSPFLSTCTASAPGPAFTHLPWSVTITSPASTPPRWPPACPDRQPDPGGAQTPEEGVEGLSVGRTFASPTETP